MRSVALIGKTCLLVPTHRAKHRVTESPNKRMQSDAQRYAFSQLNCINEVLKSNG